MAVYLDQERNHFQRMIMCHMIADTQVELHEMANKIGLRFEWFQPRSFPHYDVSQTRRTLAIRAGAVECDRRTFVRHMRRIRREILEAQIRADEIELGGL